MARIRTIKPDFFRHELLQDLEIKYPGQYIMLTFVGIWAQCDSNGVFPWRPRLLKLDILPFIPYEMEDTLNILVSATMILKFESDGKFYGHVPTFCRHQRLTGKEAQDGRKYPLPPQDNTWESVEKQTGNKRENLIAQERKGEQEGEEEKEMKGNNYSEEFSKFWDSYPVKIGKDAAWQSWQQRLHEMPSIAEVLKCIDNQKKWRDEAGKDEFRPGWKNPATWINQGCWNDEITTERRSTWFRENSAIQ